MSEGGFPQGPRLRLHSSFVLHFLPYVLGIQLTFLMDVSRPLIDKAGHLQGLCVVTEEARPSCFGPSSL